MRYFVFITVFIVISVISFNAYALITKGPYIQNVKTNRVTIMWETDAEFADELCWGIDDAKNCITEDEAVKLHKVRIDGLMPDTMYIYKVNSGDLVYTPTMSFRTAKETGTGECLFAVIGDTRTVHIMHRQVVGLVLSLKPEFVVNTGDLVEDGNSQDDWDMFFNIEQSLITRMPLVPVMGNHDDRSGSLYGQYFDTPGHDEGRNYYSFDYAVCHFIVLNTQESLDEGSDQYSWLVQDLQQATENEGIQHIYVFFHKPMYSSGFHRDGGDNSDRATILHPLFVQYGVEAVFNGHDHDYERSEHDGIMYVVAGGGGAPYFALDGDEYWIPNPDANPYRKIYLGTPHAVLMHAGDGWAKLEMYDLSGRVRDSYTWGTIPQEDDHGSKEDKESFCECGDGSSCSAGGNFVGMALILLFGLILAMRVVKQRRS